MNLIDRLFGRSDIHYYSDVYMRRWRFFNAPSWLGGWGVRLHHILRSDADREMHDHPFSFVSIILRGGYVEHRPGCRCNDHGDTVVSPRCRNYAPGSIIFRRGEDLHRLELERPAWTLVIRGRVRRRWGFQTDRGWVHWKDFVAEREGLADPGYVSTDA